MLRPIIETTQRWDVKIFQDILQLRRHSVLDSVMKLATRSADGYYYALLFTLLWVVTPFVVAPLLLPAMIGFALELPIQHLIKHLVRRNRPFEHFLDINFLLPPPDQFSFPSGHTAGAFLMVGLLGTLSPMVLIVLLLWATTVGLSRIYLGVHFPSDVVAGMILGLLSALAGFLLAGLI